MDLPLRHGGRNGQRPTTCLNQAGVQCLNKVLLSLQAVTVDNLLFQNPRPL